jgi:two-component system, sensor histidine kinase
MPVPRILIVDDDADLRDVLGIAFADRGYDVRSVVCGTEAIAVAAEWRPEVVLVDIGLPGMSGYELASRLRELPCDPMRLVAFTGFGLERDVEQARRAGFDAHVLKGSGSMMQRLDELIGVLGRL